MSSASKRIWAERRRFETVVHVVNWPMGRSGYRLTVCSSNEMPEEIDLSKGNWKPGDLDLISRRLGGGASVRQSGSTKGRALFALGYYIAPSRWRAVGALLYSMPARKSKPIQVYHVCLEQSLTDPDKAATTVLMLRAAKRVAAVTGRGGGHLQWPVDRADVEMIYQAYGFRSDDAKRQRTQHVVRMAAALVGRIGSYAPPERTGLAAAEARQADPPWACNLSERLAAMVALGEFDEEDATAIRRVLSYPPETQAPSFF